jgi:histidinol-phosphatase
VPLDRGEVGRAADAARRAVTQAGRAALRHWRTDLRVEWKADRSPVTAADRESEAIILKTLTAEFRGHSILSEESGLLEGSPENRWIVDPLDGTRGFARGGPFWGPLVAFEHRGEVVAGAVSLPALNEVYWAGRGLGAFRDGIRLRVSEVASWEEATLAVGEMRALLGGGQARGVTTLITSAASTRGYGDLAGALQLVNGRAEAWLEAGVKEWDLAALKILVEEAGGRFTDFGGGPSLTAGEALASNGLLHEHLLGALRR